MSNLKLIGIKLLMEPTMSEIENIDLLRSILNGENLEVAKFKF
jgi:hypothetical protein